MSGILGKRIQARRGMLKMTQDQVAKLTDFQVSESTIGRLERPTDKTSTMRNDRLAVLARALTTSTDYLCGLTDDPRSMEDIQRELTQLRGQVAAIEDDVTP